MIKINHQKFSYWLTNKKIYDLNIKTIKAWINKQFLLNMLKLCIYLLLVITAMSACAQADNLECSASVCATFTWNNGSCVADNTSTCIDGSQVPATGGNCTDCATLNSTQCSSTCADWYYNTSGNACQSCSSRYGADCIQCSETICTRCWTSKLLTSDNLQCITPSTNCSSANCAFCYSSSSGA